MRTLALTLAAGFALSHAALGAELPLKSITLYRSGVGYFEHNGTVDGDDTVTLRFEVDRVNDILKSMIAVDYGGGRIAGAEYQPNQPLQRRLEDFRINPMQAGSVIELMGQLKGTEVSLKTTGGEVRGVVLGVEKRPTPIGNATNGRVVDDWSITLVTKSGVATVPQADVRSFEILDESLADELSRALTVVAEHRDDRWTNIDLKFDGDRERRVMVAYTHEAPVWKTSYRLVLPAGTDAKTSIQGWAIVENDTDEDWQGVNLSLASGRPVSFIMDLQTPLILDRPIIAVPAIAGLPPTVYESGVIYDEMLKSNADRQALEMNGRNRAHESARDRAERSGMSISASPSGASPFQPPVASGNEVGEQFLYTINAPVSIRRGQSSMLPIINEAIEGRRLSIYQFNGPNSRAMRGVELTNNSGLQLMPGPIAVYDEGAFAGDAQIEHIARGAERLISYAVDHDLEIDREQDVVNEIRRLRIVNGLLERTHASQQTTTYTITNNDTNERTVLIEHLRIPGWEILGEQKPNELTETKYRYEALVPAGATEELNVVVERVWSQTLAVADMNIDEVLSFVRSNKASQAVMDAVAKAAEIKGRMNDLQERISRLNNESSEITNEQGRIRANMNAVDNRTDLYGRYMTKLNEQETRLEDIREQRASLQKQYDQAAAELKAFLTNLNVR